MGNSPEVLNFDRLFLKLNRFIGKLAVGSPRALKRSEGIPSETRTHGRTEPRGSSRTGGANKTTSPHLLSSPLLFFWFPQIHRPLPFARTSSPRFLSQLIRSLLRGHLLHQILRNAVINNNWKTRGEREGEREEGREQVLLSAIGWRVGV